MKRWWRGKYVDVFGRNFAWGQKFPWFNQEIWNNGQHIISVDSLNSIIIIYCKSLQEDLNGSIKCLIIYCHEDSSCTVNQKHLELKSYRWNLFAFPCSDPKETVLEMFCQHLDIYTKPRYKKVSPVLFVDKQSALRLWRHVHIGSVNSWMCHWLICYPTRNN